MQIVKISVCCNKPNMSANQHTHAYLYLIREREFVIREMNVFKIGRTVQKMSLKIRRFDGYKKGSEIVLVVECPINKVELMEDNLKKRFNVKFERHDDGYEYFVGDPRKMSRLIFEASDDAWDETEDLTKKNLMSNYFNPELTVNANHDMQPPPSVHAFNEEIYDISVLFDTPKKSFRDWIDERVIIQTDKMITQIEWYTDYRSYCAKCDIIPFDIKEAVSVFKDLCPSSGISFGQKTFGITLHSNKEMGDQIATNESKKSKRSLKLAADNSEMLIKIWLKSLIKEHRVITKEPAVKLHQDFLTFSSQHPLHTDISITKFGSELKAIKGVYKARSNGSKYNLNFLELQGELEQFE